LSANERYGVIGACAPEVHFFLPVGGGCIESCLKLPSLPAEIRPAAVFLKPSGADTTAVVEQAIADVLPDRVRAVELDRVKPLDLDRPETAYFTLPP
jgi:hypothetical protein